MSNQTIGIITLIYQNYTVLEDFFACLKNQTQQDFHLFAADASPALQKLNPAFPNTIFPIPNNGYSYAINRCISMAQKKGIHKFVVINNDVLFEPDFLKHISVSMDQHPASLIGGKIYYAKGYEFHADRYTTEEKGNVIWYAGGWVDWAHALTHHRGVDEVDGGKYDTIEQTKFITGCLSIFDEELLRKVGMWDESFFLYYEDADYSVRSMKAGCPLVYDPHIKLWHKNAQSTGGSGSDFHEKVQRRSHLRFSLKHAPLNTKLHVIKNYFFRT